MCSCWARGFRRATAFPLLVHCLSTACPNCLPPHFPCVFLAFCYILLHGADSAAILPFNMPYEADSAAILTANMPYEAGSAAIVPANMPYEADLAAILRFGGWQCTALRAQ